MLCNVKVSPNLETIGPNALFNLKILIHINVSWLPASDLYPLLFSAICGETLDIHFGGQDLRFPHHQNEILQCETCFGCEQWTNYWIHSGAHLFGY